MDYEIALGDLVSATATTVRREARNTLDPRIRRMLRALDKATEAAYCVADDNALIKEVLSEEGHPTGVALIDYDTVLFRPRFEMATERRAILYGEIEARFDDPLLVPYAGLVEVRTPGEPWLTWNAPETGIIPPRYANRLERAIAPWIPSPE